MVFLLRLFGWALDSCTTASNNECRLRVSDYVPWAKRAISRDLTDIGIASTAPKMARARRSRVRPRSNARGIGSKAINLPERAVNRSLCCPAAKRVRMACNCFCGADNTVGGAAQRGRGRVGEPALVGARVAARISAMQQLVLS